MNSQTIYKSLTTVLEEIAHLGGAMGVLYWDQEVIMPSGAGEARAKQLAALAGVLHDKATDPKIGEWTEKLLNSNGNNFDEFDWTNIRETKRDYDRKTKVPRELVQEIAEQSSLGHDIWVKAREENRFADFAPVLKRLVELKKRWADYIDPAQASYDVNIDDFERGATMKQLDPLFENLKNELIPLVKEIQESGYQPNNSFMQGNFPIEQQEELGRRISRDMGFSFEKGRMDISVHPFCGGGHPTDVRITTRYQPDDFVESLYAVIHETGHGLYEQGRREVGIDLPASEPLTMGIHESQSLFWERMIAHGRSFCEAYLDVIASYFPEQLKGVTVQQYYEAINVSRPSLIRIKADEITYPLHVILRYEIEKGLFDGSIEIDDLPEIWNDKMEKYLGIRPPTDALGVLQDVHWSGGSFGYFPSYTLGALYACQFYIAMQKEILDLEERILQKDFVVVKSWLNKNIHQKGRIYSTDELVRQVTGEILNSRHFVDYLKNKYRALYRLS